MELSTFNDCAFVTFRSVFQMTMPMTTLSPMLRRILSWLVHDHTAATTSSDRATDPTMTKIYSRSGTTMTSVRRLRDVCKEGDRRLPQVLYTSSPPGES